MAATIELYGIQATIDGYEWKCSDASLRQVLQAMLDPLGPSGADPNPDYHAALDAAKRLGGKVTSYDPTEYEEGTIY